MTSREFLQEHWQLSRRYFLQMGVLGCVPNWPALLAAEGGATPVGQSVKPEQAGVQLEPYFTALRSCS